MTEIAAIFQHREVVTVFHVITAVFVRISTL